MAKKKNPSADDPLEPLEGEILDPLEGTGKKDGRGRPQAEIPWAGVDYLIGINCTQYEIAGALGIHHTTLLQACIRDHGVMWREYSAPKRGKGKASLRRRLWKEAFSGNTRVLLLLAKNELGMSEKNEITMPGGGRPLAEQLNTTIDVKKLSKAALKELALAKKEKGDDDGSEPED